MGEEGRRSLRERQSIAERSTTIWRRWQANLLEPAEWVGGLFFAREHFIGGWLAGHRVGDRELGGVVVVLINLLVVIGGGVNEDAADDDQVFALALRDDAIGDRVRHGLSH